MASILNMHGLDQLIGQLRRSGNTVIGPVARDGVITPAEIRSIDDLPAGWTEEQEGGTYRLRPTGTPELFAHSSPAASWKQFLHPPQTLLIRARRSDDAIEIDESEPDASPMAFFGIRSCDLASLAVLDRVLADSERPDPAYVARRNATFIVATACAHPGNTCFCVSMGTGPTPRTGYDLLIHELHDSMQHEFLVQVGSEQGATVLNGIAVRNGTDEDHAMARQIHERAAARMGRHLHHDDVAKAGQVPEHPRWEDVAERCLACGNCTMVCPTCFCTSTNDTTNLAGDETERWRVWDSCFTLDFSYLHAGSVRTSTSARYRQWLLHKLVTWHDQFDMSGCVGCGRCITWCPVGIDLTEEIAALAHMQADAASSDGAL